MIQRALFGLFVLLVVLAPLPLGSNREWSWSLLAVLFAGLALAWIPTHLGRRAPPVVGVPLWIPVLFAAVCAWVIVQGAGWTPASWHHPLWSMTGQALNAPVAGRVSLSPEDGTIALMRLLCYALVFLLALQFGRDRKRAHRLFGWLALAGLAYAVFGLAVYWGGLDNRWLFGDRTLQHDVRSTFVNRNHFVTWQGLTILTAIGWFYQRMSKPSDKPYEVPRDRESLYEQYILRSWKPMAALLLMVTALVLTHSRGGFVAALCGTVTLLYLLDRRSATRRTSSRVVVLTALGVAALAFVLTSEVLLDRINRTDITTEERTAVFGEVGRAIGDNPVLGFGYGSFAGSFRLYDQVEDTVWYDRAHNTWLENAFELGLPAALALYLVLGGLAVSCFRAVWRRHRDWVFPATGAAASVLVGVHATVDFSLQLPAVAVLYAAILGVGVAQSTSSLHS